MKYVACVTFVCLPAVAFGGSAYIREPQIPNRPTRPSTYRVDITQKIREAREAVDEERVSVSMCTKKIHGWKGKGRRRRKWTKTARYECGREVALGVVNVRTGEVRAFELGEDEERAGFRVRRVTFNGVNSEYEVTNRENWIVLAMKTPVRDHARPVSFRPAVYTPYSPDLNTPELREAGMSHLADVIDRGYELLRKRRVRSRAFPGKLVADIIPKDVLLTLLHIEHMDPREFAELGPELLIGKVLTTVGANGANAYQYAVSHANARGLAQFIPKTYRAIYRMYHDARLHANFVRGMTDHVNAVVAQACLADNDLSELSWSHRVALLRSREALGSYIAAAYNGGPHRATRAVAIGRSRWREHGYGLARETATYVREFTAVFQYLFRQ